jgi:hypothetical protein
MSFLQPWMVWALPAIALPIVIHLVNQRRFRTIRWGAMMFLLAAQKMSRGVERLKQYLILAARTLAVAGLIFAISRPLASGWLGLAGGARPETTLILLDRSPSMQQVGRGGAAKLTSGRLQLARMLGLLGSRRWVLIDGTSPPREIDSPAALPDLAPVSSASADLPAMLLAAHNYIQANRPSRTEVWICSDVRQHDWDADSGRWQAIRDSFQDFPSPVRFHLLAYPDPPPENLSIRVAQTRRTVGPAGPQLLVSLRITSSAPEAAPRHVPIQLEIDGARSEIVAELSGSEAEIIDHAVPLDVQQLRGWGRAALPADANPADNEFYFVYDQPGPRQTIIVAEDPAAARPLELAAGISADPQLAEAAQVIEPDQLSLAEWDKASLVLWQAPLPAPEETPILRGVLSRGGVVLFFPPEVPGEGEFAGVRWNGWVLPPDPVVPLAWIGDQDLLARDRSGAALPVGQLQVLRYCTLTGDQTALATLTGGPPLLARALTDQGRAYFCATSVQPDASTLAQEGIVLYVMVQRALAAGAASLASARQAIAGQIVAPPDAPWQRLSGDAAALSSAYGESAGAYQQGDLLLAVNRSEQEDRPAIVPAERVAELFHPLPFDRVDDQAGQGRSLISEIWRLFLMSMLAMLLAEAALCLPRRGAQADAARFAFPKSPPAGGAAA